FYSVKAVNCFSLRKSGATQHLPWKSLRHTRARQATGTQRAPRAPRGRGTAGGPGGGDARAAGSGSPASTGSGPARQEEEEEEEEAELCRWARVIFGLKTMGRKDASTSRTPVDQYRKQIGKQDYKKTRPMLRATRLKAEAKKTALGIKEVALVLAAILVFLLAFYAFFYLNVSNEVDLDLDPDEN
uniref:Triple QxxK/R motif-containing protein n=2 Tax=Passeriformes TaxID=9126 RepID=A0A674HN96_TAEGU